MWRLLIRVDADVLSAVLTRWLRARARPVVVSGRRWRLVVAIDGKVERGARLPDGRQVHLLSAYDSGGLNGSQVGDLFGSHSVFCLIDGCRAAGCWIALVRHRAKIDGWFQSHAGGAFRASPRGLFGMIRG